MRQVYGDASKQPHVHSLAHIQRELEDVQSLIRLQEEKLQLLAQLRSTALDTEATMQQQTHQAGYERASKSLERQLDEAIAAAAHASWSARFESHFVERAAISLDSSVVDLKMDKLRGMPTHELIVVAFRDGEIAFFVSPGEQILQIPTGLRIVHSVQLDLGAESPVLAVFGRSADAASSTIISYSLDLRRHGRDLLRPASDGSSSSTTSSSSTSNADSASDTAPTFASAASSLYALTVSELHRFDFPESQAVSAFSLVRASRRSMLGVAHISGRMAFFAANGTLLHELELGRTSTPITALTSQRNVLAFALNTSTVLFVMSRQQQPELHVCPGSLANVVSIAFDPTSSELLYSATADGEILSYSFRTNGSPSCRLRHRAVVQRGAAHAIVVPQSGYVVACGPDTTSVFNASRSAADDGAMEPMTLLCSRRTTASLSPSSLPVITAADNAHGATIALLRVSSPDSVTLNVLQSLLPEHQSEPTETSLWRGALFIGMVAVVVITTQCVLRRQSPRPEDDQQWKDIIDKFGSMDGRAAAAAHPATGPMNRHMTGDRREYGKPRMSPAYDDMSDSLRKKIEEARRETLECSFDSDEHEDDLVDDHMSRRSQL
ncbi:hypothetical protein ATCC90586_002595 [Pythium insidiosum]|nr:hypothetical protein ATCC90586_002595 [Pythium insidiosum]